ncbi:MAG: hypothetical protein IJR99_02770 [Kiritimatiellae bacterium]|nr:hypothetical protein [Kiritimatiellia bacterium]
MKWQILFGVCLGMAWIAAAQTVTRAGYVVVTDTIPADGKTDVADRLQALIDANPNRTIYFPDGVYLLGHPVATPAHPKRSVDLRLSNFAVLKAAENWNSPEAIIRMGGKDPANDIRTIGSNYGFTGGIVDGSGKANGISIDGGRETTIREVSIKHTRVGIHIKHGANSGSSDSDVMSVNIVGNRARDSIGVLLEGYDNTLSNMRIADVYIGVELRSAGNSLRNIHPLYTCDYTDYEDSTGFWDKTGNNWYSFCYSDHFGTGFRTARSCSSTMDSCFVLWYAAKGKRQLSFRADEMFNSYVTNFRVGFHQNSVSNVILQVGTPGGVGFFNHISVNEKKLTDQTHKAYVK